MEETTIYALSGKGLGAVEDDEHFASLEFGDQITLLVMWILWKEGHLQVTKESILESINLLLPLVQEKGIEEVRRSYLNTYQN